MIIIVIVLSQRSYQFCLLKTQTPVVEPAVAQPVHKLQGQPVDETAGWKTYTNTKYGFEFKYPQSYSIQDIKEGIMVIAKSASEDYGLADLNVQINQDNSFKNLSLDEIMQAKLKGISVSNIQKTTIAGQPAYEGISLGIVSFYAVYLKNGNNFFE